MNTVNWEKITAIPVAHWSDNIPFRQLVALLFYNYKFFIKDNVKNPIVIEYSHAYAKRKDFDSAVNALKSILTLNDFNYSEISFVRKVSLKYFFRKAYRILRFMLINKNEHLIRAYELTLLDCVMQYSSYYVNTKPSVVFTFCDAHPTGALVTQISSDSLCITLQHGQYRLSNLRQLQTENQLIHNFSSDYLLAWNEATNREFSKIGVDNNKCLVVGALGKLKVMECLGEEKRIDLFLNADNMVDVNREMIQIAQQVSKIKNIPLNIKFHPRSNRGLYLKQIRPVKFIPKKSFSPIISVYHSSGVYVDLLGITILAKYKKNNDEFFPGYSFESVEDLIAIINKIELGKITAISTDVENFIPSQKTTNEGIQKLVDLVEKKINSNTCQSG